MNKILYLSLAFLSLVSCQNRNPNLSAKLFQALMNDSIQRVAEILSDTSYVPPAGARFTEIRAVDPVAPPVIIDIAGNLDNKKLFKLSDFSSSVRYIHLQQPPDVTFTSIRDVVSDDDRIFVNTLEGLFCYSAEGQYLYTMCINELETSNMGTRIVSGVLNNVDLLNGRLIYRTYHWPLVNEEGVTDVRLNMFDVKELEAQMLFNVQNRELLKSEPQPQYQRRLNPKKDTGLSSRYLLMDDQSLFINNTLTNVAIYGDTLCKFNDYDKFIQPPGAYVFVPSYSYRIDGQVMLQKGHNDTVFRVVPPNRLTPAYVMQWGEYKPDISQHAAGSDLEGKLVLQKWVETSRYIFIEYTEGRNYPARRRQGKVNFHWAIYDKTAKTLTHHLTSPIPAMRDVNAGTMTISYPMPAMFENDIDPVGMPFWPAGVNHKGEMHMTFSKKDIKSYITTGKFQNNKLQAIHDNMPDDGFCIMLVK